MEKKSIGLSLEDMASLVGWHIVAAHGAPDMLVDDAIQYAKEFGSDPEMQRVTRQLLRLMRACPPDSVRRPTYGVEAWRRDIDLVTGDYANGPAEIIDLASRRQVER